MPLELTRTLSDSLQIQFVQGDITEISVDVIVSSDDTWLSMGGGVSGRILQRGGEAVLDRTNPKTGESFGQASRARIGEVYVSDGGKLLATHVFHTAVVDWERDIAASPEAVHAASYECLRIAADMRKDSATPVSIAFPLMGTGAGGLGIRDSVVALLGAAWDAASSFAAQFKIIICFPLADIPLMAWGETIDAVISTMSRPMATSSVETPRLVKAETPMEDSLTRVARLPAPIAVSLFSTLQQSPAQVRMNSAIEAAEATVRLLVACVIGADLPTERRERVERLINALGSPRPTLGHWLRTLRENIEVLRHFDAPLADWLGKGSKSTNLGKLLLGSLAPIRNQYTGHGKQLPDESYAEPLLELRPFIQDEFEALRNFRLVSPVSFDWSEGTGIRYALRALEGPLAVFPTIIQESEDRLRTKHVYLMRTADNCWLDLDPIVVFAVCPKCQNEDVFFFEKLSHGSIGYRSFVSGHERSVGLLS